MSPDSMRVGTQRRRQCAFPSGSGLARSPECLCRRFPLEESAQSLDSMAWDLVVDSMALDLVVPTGLQVSAAAARRSSSARALSPLPLVPWDPGRELRRAGARRARRHAQCCWSPRRSFYRVRARQRGGWSCRDPPSVFARRRTQPVRPCACSIGAPRRGAAWERSIAVRSAALRVVPVPPVPTRHWQQALGAGAALGHHRTFRRPSANVRVGVEVRPGSHSALWEKQRPLPFLDEKRANSFAAVLPRATGLGCSQR